MNRQRVAAVAISILGGLLVTVQVLQWPSVDGIEFYKSLPFVWIALTIVYAGVWLFRHEQYSPYSDTVLAWTLGSGLTFGAVAILAVVGGTPAATVLTIPVEVIDTLTAGALAGTMVGLYDAQSRDRFFELQSERDRVERFAHKAASLNTYGKALNQTRGIHELSGLCIEVLELLIGSRDAAVVLVDTEVMVLDATLAKDRRDLLTSSAREIALLEPMESVRCPSEVDCPVPEELGVTEVVAVPIDSSTVGTVVLMALPKEDGTYSEEDRDLLESLSAHVGTALSGIEQRTLP